MSYKSFSSWNKYLNKYKKLSNLIKVKVINLLKANQIYSLIILIVQFNNPIKRLIKSTNNQINRYKSRKMIKRNNYNRSNLLINKQIK